MKIALMRGGLSALFVLLFLVACDRGAPPPAKREAPRTVDLAAPSPWRVADTFRVGDSVFVRSLAVEPATNSLWVGTSVGVLQIDLKTYAPRNTFTRKDGLANEYVFAIGIDPQGYKWFGTNGGGASRYKDGQWQTFFPLHGLADYWIYTFTAQRNGTWWIGTWAGANAWDPKTGQFTTYVKELVNEWVYGLAVDSHDRVWFGTEGGMSMYDGTAWHSWTHADGLGAPNHDNLPPSRNTGLGTRSRHDLSLMRQGKETYNPNYVFAVWVDPQDRVWAGTWGGGVSRYDGQRWRNLSTRDGLAGNVVYSIVQGDDGVFWFGTNKGISRYDGHGWQTFDRSTGLLDNHVYALAVSPDGDVWAATKGGVNRLSRRPPVPHQPTR